MGFDELFDSVLAIGSNVFGRPVIYRPAEGGFVPIQGIFDAAYKVIMLRGGLEYSTISPKLSVRLIDLPSLPVQGDGIEVDSVVYEIVDVQPDGHGGASLILQKS